MKARIAILGCLLALTAGCSSGTSLEPANSTRLEGADETVPAPEHAPSGCVSAQHRLETAAPLNLRQGPSTDASVLLTLPEGTELSAASGSSCPDHGFYKVRFGGFEGWVYGAHLRSTQLDSALSYGNTRDEALARARSAVGFSYWWAHGRWVTTGATSSNKGSCTGSCGACSHSGSYGADCSGFAAKVWVVPSSNDDVAVDSHPYSTYSFENEYHGWHNVARDDMQRADAMVYNENGAGHIFIFEKGDPWGSVYAYECKGCATGCVYNLRSASSSYKGIGRDGMTGSASGRKAGPAVFYDEQDGTGRIYRWSSNGSTFGTLATYNTASYSLSHVGARFVSGDFTGDGHDDVATAYQYSDGTFQFHVWRNGLSYDGSWFQSGIFNLSNVQGRIVSGDFNNDNKDDIALVYDQGDGTMRIYRWLSNGSSFSAYSTYDSGPFSLSNVGDRVASADFDGDGSDDIVMAYQNPDGTFSFHVWKNGLSYAGKWLTSGTFSLSAVQGRIVAGRFTSDSKADVALVYDQGDGTMRIYRWVSSGTAFSSYNVYDSGPFSLSAVGDRVAAGDADGDGDDDIVLAYQNSDGSFSTYVWEDLTHSGTWYTSGPFPLSRVGGRFVLGAW
ncbi:FG-GAP-like repeat-containing protein [Archangium sp.]|uniref:FG-GAP-like repeat-containing protein n=1 Tax=Archangium sp. TaxID=1872627 RepID=UPI002D26F4E9|nr:FG-GAP-like repeat-containing protein [Archangium sp.]HYO59526.1 FG-GAP-like repeat-containing protein [Archangium sp.]